MRSTRRWILTGLLVAAPLFAQQRPFSIEVFGAYTTSSKLFPYPNDPEEIRRAFYLSVEDIFHAGAEVRASMSSLGLQFGLGTEFIQKTATIDVPLASTSVPVRDGFRVIPIELTGYFYLPFGNDRLGIYLGGGAGFYTGERIYQYASASSDVTNRSSGFGIHVLCGGEYMVLDHWALRSEFKIRDIQFESVNQFSQPTVIYEGIVVPLPQEPLSSRFSIDGLTMLVGIAYHF